jgi:hypothetical protein
MKGGVEERNSNLLYGSSREILDISGGKSIDRKAPAIRDWLGRRGGRQVVLAANNHQSSSQIAEIAKTRQREAA